MDEKSGDNSSQLTSEVPTQHQDTAGGAKPYAANRAKRLGLSHIICGCVTFLIDTIKMVIFLEPSYAIAASVAWFLSGGFAMAGAITKTRCMVVATMVLSIISAINAGILFLIQVVTIFGIQPDYNNDCYCPKDEVNQTLNQNISLPSTNPTTLPYCCQYENNNHSNNDNLSHFGPDNVIYLLVGLAMLPISIYSAALACLAKEQEKPPPTWPGAPPPFYPGQHPSYPNIPGAPQETPQTLTTTKLEGK